MEAVHKFKMYFFKLNILKEIQTHHDFSTKLDLKQSDLRTCLLNLTNLVIFTLHMYFSDNWGGIFFKQYSFMV